MPDSPHVQPLPATAWRLVVMGVSGAGKSTVGAALAERLGLRFVDSDALHAPHSIDKLRHGIPLDDADRWPWLDRVGACLCDTVAAPHGTVVACSALKRAHRDRLRAAARGLRFVFLDMPPALLQSRMTGRVGHPMPVSLLPSQLQTLERPGPDESDVVPIAVVAAVDEVVAACVRALAE